MVSRKVSALGGKREEGRTLDLDVRIGGERPRSPRCFCPEIRDLGRGFLSALFILHACGEGGYVWWST
jgi:hypothetical protein